MIASDLIEKAITSRPITLASQSKGQAEVSMINRVELLHSLLRFDQPLTKILLFLKPFGWDSDRELVILERQHVAAILERYLTDELSPAQLEDWANALKSREDIGSVANKALRICLMKSFTN